MRAEDRELLVAETSDITANQAQGDYRIVAQASGNISMGLWKAGNTLAEKASTFVATAAAYNLSLQGNVSSFSREANLQWVQDNVPEVSRPSARCSHDCCNWVAG